MSWLGKIVGGALGLAFGGPLGAVLGAAVGHKFDKSEQVYLTGGGNLTYDEQAQLTFFVAVFSMLAKLAKVDGRVTEEEIRSIDEFMIRDLRLNPESRRVAVDVFRSAVDSPERFESFAMQFHEQFRSQPRILEMMIDILLRVSVADGSLTSEEERLILSAVGIFNFSDSAYRNLKARYVEEADTSYAVLGCRESDSDDEVKKRYRSLVKEYHPDRIVAKGLPEEFTNLAQDKFREVQEAYEVIKRKRGF